MEQVLTFFKQNSYESVEVGPLEAYMPRNWNSTSTSLLQAVIDNNRFIPKLDVSGDLVSRCI